MKPLKREATIFLLLILCNIVFATIPDTTEYHKIPDYLKRELSVKMTFPQEAADKQIEGVVTTCFYLTKEGDIIVTCLNGPPVLTAYVKRKLESTDLKRTYTMVNKPMLLRFRFEHPLY